MHKPRDFNTSSYQRVIAISDTMLKKIDEIRGKKSKAGKLDEIINYYLNQHSL